MVRFFQSRKLGITDLTWEEKNPSEYIYYPKENYINKLQKFIQKEGKSKQTKETETPKKK